MSAYVRNGLYFSLIDYTILVSLEVMFLYIYHALFEIPNVIHSKSLLHEVKSEKSPL